MSIHPPLYAAVSSIRMKVATGFIFLKTITPRRNSKFVTSAGGLGLHEVGHSGVAAGRGACSLSSSNQLELLLIQVIFILTEMVYTFLSICQNTFNY